MIYQDCKELYINYFQCKFANFSVDFVNAARFGKCKLDEFKDLQILISRYIEQLYRYTVFQEEITYLYSIEITNEATTSETISITVDGTLLATYTGTDDATYVAAHLANQINSSADYLAEIDNNTIYLYSYATGASYTNVPVISSTSSSLFGTNTSLEGSEETLLDFWNCITNDQINGIIGHLEKILSRYTTANDVGNNVTSGCLNCN